MWPVSAVIITERVHTHTRTGPEAGGEGVNSEVRGLDTNNRRTVQAPTLAQWLTTSATQQLMQQTGAGEEPERSSTDL